MILFILSFFFFPPKQLAYQDADNPGEAYGLVAMEDKSQEYIRSQCVEWLPQYKQEIDHAYFNWRDRNERELFVAARMLKTLPHDMNDLLRNNLSKIEAILNMIPSFFRQPYCIKMAQGYASGSSDIAERTPNASRYLLSEWKKAPSSIDEDRAMNNVAGCIKSGLNQGLDYDLLVSYCDCVQSSVFSDLDDREYAGLETATAENDTAAIQSIFLPHRDQFESCLKSAQLGNSRLP